MVHWGRAINKKAGVPEYVANFTGAESWRSITSKLSEGSVTCAQLQRWLQDGVSVGKCSVGGVTSLHKTAADCVGTSTPDEAIRAGVCMSDAGVVESTQADCTGSAGEWRVWTSTLAPESSLYSLREAMDATKAECLAAATDSGSDTIAERIRQALKLTPAS